MIIPLTIPFWKQSQHYRERGHILAVLFTYIQKSVFQPKHSVTWKTLLTTQTEFR